MPVTSVKFPEEDQEKLTVVDLQVLSDIMRSGGLVMISQSPSDYHQATTIDGHTVPLHRLRRLLRAGKLVASDDGLFSGMTQTYRAKS